uniref:cytochrome c heme attachment protein n=1 Tax=Lithothamnion corallioides TaxID=1277934 RepID=UPI0023F1E07B|nr:cytochrome c heme attachment protein [Lithothamnion corallioides]WEA76965.1 cytochrome c heme attachment protein [Lithothamnion corallioides]
MDWNLFENFFVNTSFGLLLISLIVYWSNLTFPEIKKLGKIGIGCTILINTCLFITLLSRWILNGYFPLSNLYESLLFLTWSLTFTHIILERKNNSKIIGAINMPICLFIIAFASFSLPPEMQKASPLVPALRSNWLMMHVTIMMISYATLIIGSLLSILFLIIAKNNEIEIQGSSINQISSKPLTISSLNTPYKLNNNKILIKSTNKHSKLTLLESLDNLSYRIIGLGFPLLTIGIIAGAVWANEAWGSYWSWDPKETWALITWLIFASYLHSRFTKSWKGKKPAILASIGFFVVWICYLGVNFLGKGLHSYGWLL